MTDTTLSLAARLAANLIANAIDITMIAAGGIGAVAAKIGDRLLGGSPFDERRAMEFLTMGAANQLNEAEAQVDSLEPWWSDGGPTEFLGSTPPVTLKPPLPAGCTCEPAEDEYSGALMYDCLVPEHLAEYRRWSILSAPEHNIMPNWQAPKSSAPVAPKPTDVAGHLNQPVGVGVAPGTGAAVICGDKTESAGVGHHCACYLPLGHDSWHRCGYCTTRRGDGATALRLEIATVCEVLAAHEAFDYAGKVECPHRSDSEVCDDWEAWRQHVAPLIVAALKAPK